MMMKNFRLEMLTIPFVLLLIFSTFAYQFLVIYPPHEVSDNSEPIRIIKNQNAQIFTQTLVIFLFIMTLYSYYVTIVSVKLCRPPATILPIRKRSQLKFTHFLYQEIRKCQKCNPAEPRYKPPRCSHCKKCGSCILRMDHHCPYIAGCIGLRNIKSFTLFTIYSSAYALVHLILSIQVYNQITIENSKLVLSSNELIGWIVLGIFSILCSLSILSLVFQALIMSARNLCALDLFKGYFKFQDKKRTHPNIYDLGVFTNWNIVFEGDPFLFWFPTIVYTQNDGYDYPMRQPVDHIAFNQLVSQQIKDDLVHMNLFYRNVPKNRQQMMKNEAPKYKGVRFTYLGQDYMLDDKGQPYEVDYKQIKSENQKQEVERGQFKVEQDDGQEDPKQNEQDLKILQDVYSSDQ